jgi:ribosomal protein L7Ae-like RNA K-turn-binding protein
LRLRQRKNRRVQTMTSRSKRSALMLLGLARRAGALERGTGATQRAVRDGSARLVLLAQDASEVQLEKVLKLLRHRETPRGVLGSRAELGAAVGSAPLSAVAVTDKNLASQLVRQVAVNVSAHDETERR